MNKIKFCKNPADIEYSKVKVIQRSRIYITYHGDTPKCQICYAYVKEQRRSCTDINSWWKYNFDIEVKSQCPTEVMNVAHCSMVKHSLAKYGMTMLKDQKAVVRTQKHAINPFNLTLRSKGNVLSGLWMYATLRLKVIHPCVKYGKPMSSQKKLWTGNESAQTGGQTDRRKERQTDGQSDYYIPPWISFMGGIIMFITLQPFDLTNLIEQLQLPAPFMIMGDFNAQNPLWDSDKITDKSPTSVNLKKIAYLRPKPA